MSTEHPDVQRRYNAFLPDSVRAMRPAAAALPRAVARLCVLGLWVSLVVCARGEDSGGRVGMEVVFPPERHVFQHADEVQFALLFDVESPEVCAGMRVCTCGCAAAAHACIHSRLFGAPDSVSAAATVQLTARFGVRVPQENPYCDIIVLEQSPSRDDIDADMYSADYEGSSSVEL